MVSLSENSKKRLTNISLIASCVIAVAGAMAVFKIEFPRPAWSAELKQLHSQVLILDSTLTSQQLDNNKLRLFQNKREQLSWYKETGTIPEFLLNEQILLERKIDDLQTHLDFLRSQAN